VDCLCDFFIQSGFSTFLKLARFKRAFNLPDKPCGRKPSRLRGSITVPIRGNISDYDLIRNLLAILSIETENSTDYLM